MALCTEIAFGMFPEGKGAPKAMPKVGSAARLTNELLYNSSTGVDALWKARGYHRAHTYQCGAGPPAGARCGARLLLGVSKT